jgi:hypothetical protein
VSVTSELRVYRQATFVSMAATLVARSHSSPCDCSRPVSGGLTPRTQSDKSLSSANRHGFGQSYYNYIRWPESQLTV